MTYGTDAVTEYEAVVIGAGFSGLGMLYHLRQIGVTAHAYEAGDGVGGTWYWNRYPGAASDSFSEVYSFSFSLELLREWTWETRYPTQPQILAYLNHVADRFDLRRDISFQTRVISATFDETDACWLVRTDQDEIVRCQFLITGVGCLSNLQLPAITGLDTFKGDWYHTSRWPTEPVDFRGKRVAVIGTGSTGIQCIPVIAEQAAHLTVFQRTPNFALPARNRPLTSADQKRIKDHYAAIREEVRTTISGNQLYPRPERALDVPDDQRQGIYEADWQLGGFKMLFGGFSDLMTDEAANATAANFVRSKIAEVVKDPDTVEKLIPRDYPIGTKRIPLETNYFDTFNRTNVRLIDIRRDPIVDIVPTGIRTTAEEHHVDLIVFATGFDAITGALSAIDIRGRKKRLLKEKWLDGPQAYLGLASSGFPNMFMITGPGSPGVLSNMPISIEQHVEWVRDCIKFMRRNGYTIIEAAPVPEQGWADRVESLAEGTLMKNANSWFNGANIPGKPHKFLPYLGGVGEYRQTCSEVAADGYKGFILS